MLRRPHQQFLVFQSQPFTRCYSLLLSPPLMLPTFCLPCSPFPALLFMLYLYCFQFPAIPFLLYLFLLSLFCSPFHALPLLLFLSCSCFPSFPFLLSLSCSPCFTLLFMPFLSCFPGPGPPFLLSLTLTKRGKVGLTFPFSMGQGAEMLAYRSSLFRSLKKEVSEKLPQVPLSLIRWTLHNKGALPEFGCIWVWSFEQSND